MSSWSGFGFKPRVKWGEEDGHPANYCIELLHTPLYAARYPAVNAVLLWRCHVRRCQCNTQCHSYTLSLVTISNGQRCRINIKMQTELYNQEGVTLVTVSTSHLGGGVRPRIVQLGTCPLVQVWIVIVERGTPDHFLGIVPKCRNFC